MQNDTMNANKSPQPIARSLLAQFEPMARLSLNRLEELAAVCYTEYISRNLDPTRMKSHTQALYLVKGDLGIRYELAISLFCVQAPTPPNMLWMLIA